MRKLVYAVFGLFYLQSCVQQKAETSSKEHPIAVQDAYMLARKSDNLRSLLVSHNDVLIAEEYFYPYSGDSLDHVRSVTKSIMSTLIGIAIDKGIISSVDQSVHKYLGKAAEGKEKVTIAHLLTMTSGISWNEGANAEGYGAWASSSNELKYVLDKPMAAEPGKVWNYNSGAIHILSAILTEASGMSTLKFAREHLFEPIGIDNVKWEKHKDGYYNGAAGLELKPRDMLRFGQLYANGGILDGKRVVSEDFIREATSHQQPKDMVLDENNGYGYCWWLGEAHDIEAFVAQGYAGQTIAVFPELNIVISITHNWRVNGTKASEQEEHSLNTMLVRILEGLLEK